MNTDFCVFVGRFQPFHNAHLKIIKNALKKSEKVIICIGSYRTSLSIKNPWTFMERARMIEDSLTREEFERIIFIPIRDYMYNNTAWISSLQNQISKVTQGNKFVRIIGHFKDDSSVYLKWFPDWKLIEQPNFDNINGTDIRKKYFENDNDWKNNIPLGTLNLMDSFKTGKWHNNIVDSFHGRYDELKKDYEFIKGYKKLWKDSPFPPTFVTTDAIVVQSGHVLLVKRKINPGKGKYALPGGFLGINENIFDSCLRELYEETKIDIAKSIMKRCVVDQKVFDHPRRSLRGRTITHTFLFKLEDDKPLPDVTAADDAEEAFWMSFNDLALNEENMYEDHIHIIQHFINKI